MGSFLNTAKVKFRGFIRKVKEKFQTRFNLNVDQVVNDYDAFLQYGLVTTSSFQDILDGKLNQRRRALQLIIMIYYWVYFIPRYCIVCLLYFQDEKTRKHYQYILADYGEEMGMFGRTANVGYIIFCIGVFLNNMVMRKFQAQGSLEFLTDWLKRIPMKTSIEDEDGDKVTASGDLDNESKHKLISGLHYKLILARIMARNVINAQRTFELVAFSIFMYKRRPSFFITCLGLWNCITTLYQWEYHALIISAVCTCRML